MSGTYYFEDDIVSVVSDEEEAVEDLSDNPYAQLNEEAVSAQRLLTMRNTARYVNGVAVSPRASETRKWTPEKMFRVSALYEWLSGDPVQLIDDMRRGRVRTRVSAAMGVGKSTKLPFYVANELGLRVLYVSLDPGAMDQVNRYVTAQGIGRFSRLPSKKKQARVNCMTYGDFCAEASMTNRGSLIKDFDVYIFDESFVKSPDVVAALKIFSVIAGPETHLLLCSANIRTDSVDTVMANGAGSVKVIQSSVTPEQAMASGKLVSDYLVDRSMVFLPNDERVADMRDYYEGQGVDVRSLDSASSIPEIQACEKWLLGDSVTPRVLVCTPRFGIAYNFAVSFVLLWPQVSQAYLDGNAYKWRVVPMSQAMVNQILSRAGRGIAEGAGGMVMGAERGVDGDMSFLDKLEEFVLLTAANIRPLQIAYWDECYKLFPDGLTPMTAQEIRRSNLPTCVAVRYLAKDGLFAKKYARAVMTFAQMAKQIEPSDHDDPVAYDDWVVEPVFEAPHLDCKVPVHAVGELGIVLQAISAIADDKLVIKRWITDLAMPFSDGGDHKGDLPVTHELQQRRLKKVSSFERPMIAPPSPTIEEWSYRSEVAQVNSEIGGPRSRNGVNLTNARFKDAVRVMRKAITDYEVPTPHVDYVDTDQGTVGNLEILPPDGVVESPGGTVVCTLPANVCDALNRGLVMNYDQFRFVVDAFRVYVGRFVGSRVFDAYSTPWTSVCHTLMDDDIVVKLVRNGLSSHAYGMVAMLQARFSMELVGAASTSNVLKSRLQKFLGSAPTFDGVMSLFGRGTFDNIAQSRSYIARVQELKYWLDCIYVVAERNCVFLPNYITAAQSTLPIHALTPLGRQGAGMVENPLVRKRIKHKREISNPMLPGYRPTKEDYDEWR